MKRLVLLVVVFMVVAVGLSKIGSAEIYRIERGVIKDLEPGRTSGQWSLVENGGAESGSITPWYVPSPGSTKGFLSVSSEHVFDGKYAFEMGTVVDNPDRWGIAGCIDVTLEKGIYVIGGFVYFDGTNVGRTYFDLGDVFLYDESGQRTKDDSIPTDPSSIGWQYVYGIFEFTEDTNLRLRFVRDGAFSKNTSVWFDDVSITPQDQYRAPHSNVVPEPFTVGLMGLGLLGFGIGLRRR